MEVMLEQGDDEELRDELMWWQALRHGDGRLA